MSAPHARVERIEYAGAIDHPGADLLRGKHCAWHRRIVHANLAGSWLIPLTTIAALCSPPPSLGAAKGPVAEPPDPGVSRPLTLREASGAGQTRDAVPGISAGRKSITATRTDSPPRIDARLDDPVWQNAVRVTEFVQQRPFEGAPASERTEVSIAYDSRNIYLGIYAHYSDPALVRANRVDRDQIENDDTVQVFLDPFLDQQRGYVFSVNGYGV